MEYDKNSDDEFHDDEDQPNHKEGTTFHNNPKVVSTSNIG